MLSSFAEHEIATSGTTIHTLTAGSGPAILLLHGYPQTHLAWRKIAPRLAEAFTVVAPDLRGYGRSGKPPSDPYNRTYSKRTMAQDMLEVMEALGHQRFMVAGHDRGGRVAYRMALDHPARVLKLATLDILPTLTTWGMLRGTSALEAYHWLFLAQPHDLPERLIGGDPSFFVRWTLASWSGEGGRGALEPEAVAAYERAFRDPQTIRATCDDHRAGATTDLEADRADLAAAQTIRCPVLVLWGAASGIPSDIYLRTWRLWADDVRGLGLPCGHFLPEEAPGDTAAALLGFFGSRPV